MPADQAGELECFVQEFDAVLKNEYAGCDDNISLTCRQLALEGALTQEVTANILRTLLVVPQGVQAMNVDFPGLVQTSLNLGIMGMEEDGLHFSLSIRSCIASQKAMMVQRIRAILALGGGTVSERSDYPGWQYARESALREDVLAVYKEVCGKDGTIEATHGGLECGLFIEKMPGLDVISMGPELHDVHSVQERLNVASTRRVYEVTCKLLERSR